MSTAGLLADDADLAFATDTLTATKFIASTSFSGPTLGVTTNSNANAGEVGELISSAVESGASVGITTNTDTNITSISLTAGDWDVSAIGAFTPAASTSVTVMSSSISTTSATRDSAAGNLGAIGEASAGVVTGAVNTTVSVGPRRLSLSGTTTVYLVSRSTFTVSTMSCWGILRARRVR